jgi:ligand-binding sensor domain-containing protein
MHKFQIFSIALAVTFAISARSQSKDIKFRHLTTAHGLSHDHVQGIIRDSEGFMWFATEGGLNKYDGYEFNVYRNRLK